MKTLMLYYSYTQNTKQIAQRVRDTLDCDIAELLPVTPYSDDYDTVVEQGQQEVGSGTCPPIQPLEVDVSGYDWVILGTPVWWYTMAPAVRTFLQENSLAGKTVVPLMTNGGWLGHTLKDIVRLCPEAVVEHGLNLKFDGTRLVTPEPELAAWIDGLKHTKGGEAT